MIPGWWTKLVVSERIADLRREAKHQRLVRPARIRLQHRSPWPGLELRTQRGDRS
jgi:hypothetical protein